MSTDGRSRSTPAAAAAAPTKAEPLKNITLRALRIFDAAASGENFSRAALALTLTQPAVSMQIKQLEEDVGLRLFEKQAGRVALTAAGRALLVHTRDILARIDIAEAALATFGAAAGGQLHVGAISPAHYLIPWLMQTFRAQYPHVRLKLSVGERGAMLDALCEQRLDLVIAGFAPVHAQVEAEPFAHHPHCLVAGAGHRLAGRRGIAWQELRDEPFIHREAGSATRQFFEHLLRAHTIQADVTAELQGHEAVKQAVMAGMGISFMSASACQVELEAGRMVALDVKDTPQSLDWCLLHRRGAAPSGVGALFRSFVLEHGARLAASHQA